MSGIMENRGFLVNTINPIEVKTNIFPVASQAVRLRAFGLTGNNYVQLEHQVGLASDGLWEPVYRGGNPVRLTAVNTQHIELIRGVYRVVIPGSEEGVEAVVYFETDGVLLDNNLIYNYNSIRSEASTNPPATPQVDTQVFNSDGTWTKPAFGNFVRIVCIGGGGGGGSGRRALDPLEDVASGGGGGQGGGYTDITLPIAQVPDTAPVTVGTGGPGGAAVTVDNTDGNPGTSGLFSAFDFSLAGAIAVATGGAGGDGGTNTTANGGSGEGGGMFVGGAGGDGGAPAAATAPNVPFGGGGGGGGGGWDTATAGNGSNGANVEGTFTLAGAGGVAPSGAGGVGTTSGNYVPGPGGGGGAGSAGVAAAGNGGIGGLYGSGGGGGGGCPSGVNSGAGANGSNGIVVVYTF